jgi:hypothetical protein
MELVPGSSRNSIVDQSVKPGQASAFYSGFELGFSAADDIHKRKSNVMDSIPIELTRKYRSETPNRSYREPRR